MFLQPTKTGVKTGTSTITIIIVLCVLQIGNNIHKTNKKISPPCNCADMSTLEEEKEKEKLLKEKEKEEEKLLKEKRRVVKEEEKEKEKLLKEKRRVLKEKEKEEERLLRQQEREEFHQKVTNLEIRFQSEIGRVQAALESNIGEVRTECKRLEIELARMKSLEGAVISPTGRNIPPPTFDGQTSLEGFRQQFEAV
ncbi:hypothetical protein LAZ67_X001762 [Cordylochernes scorpioides]|uniref:Uncharacterized protein n=1 Tax=Cordylochernes scorpioides TaxID=51811 RepID=A0ABY6LWZ8_9ARAC|nr:hypothetical protein LAZ67_X001762 [Cordylochernes scorpioides]